MRPARLLLRAALAVAYCMAARPAAALPPAVNYPGETDALKEPNASEREVLELIQKDRTSHDLPPLRWDGTVSAVAREHSEDMAANSYADCASPRLGTLQYCLRRAGISAPGARCSVCRASWIGALKHDLKTSLPQFDAASDVGIGVATKGDKAAREVYATLIFVEKHSTLKSFPTQPTVGAEYTLSGALEEGFDTPMLAIMTPDGRVTERPLNFTDGDFTARVRFNRGSGEYILEITAVGKLGPTVVQLLHCYAGMEYPEPSEPPKPAAAPADLREAERAMADRINQARADAHLPPLTYDAGLADLARGHSEDMAKNNFFAQISPTEGDLLARATKAGLHAAKFTKNSLAAKFTENIVSSPDLDEAHQEIMDSPSRRRNIMYPLTVAVGVGIVRDESGRFLVTEDFLQQILPDRNGAAGFSRPAYTVHAPDGTEYSYGSMVVHVDPEMVAPDEQTADYDCGALMADLARAINEARTKAHVCALGGSGLFAGVALQNSSAMMARGIASPDKAKAVLDAQKKLPRGYVAWIWYNSTHRPTPAESFKGLMDPAFRQMDIGIVEGNAPSGKKWLWTTVIAGP